MGFWTALKSIFGGKSEKDKVLDEAMQEAQVELDKFEPKKGFKPVEMELSKTKAKRARTKKGRYVKDDKSTPNVNEAYEDGKTPADRNKRARGKKGKFKGDDKSTKRTNEAYKGGRKPKRRGRPKGSKNKKK